MNQEITTTMPISYRQGRGLKMLITPWYAKCISVLTGTNLRLPLNFHGRRYVPTDQFESVRDEFSSRMQATSCHVQPRQILTDKDPAFLQYAEQTIQKLIDEGVIVRDVRRVMTCQCGTIDLLESAASEVLASRRGKFLQARDGVPFCCNECCQPTTSKSAPVLILKRDEGIVALQSVHSEKMIRRVQVDLEAHSHRELLVSKLPDARDDASTLKVGGYLIDPDMLLGLYLPYLEATTGCSRITVVAGFTTLSQVVRALTISLSGLSTAEVSLVVHPKIQFDASVPSTWEEATTRGRNPRTTMQSLIYTMQSGRYESRYHAGNYKLCELTFPHFQQMPSRRILLTKRQASDALSLAPLAATLKKLRRRVHGFSEEPRWELLNSML
jgi:hypothetical protein